MASLKKFTMLMAGLFLLSVGLLLTIHADLGAAPWQILELGITKHTGLRLGQISQIVGITIILMNILLKEAPGLSTVFNMYFVGFFIDLIESWSLIPSADTFWAKIGLLVCGIFLLSWGSFFYLNAGWGAGPRDGLMLGLSKRFSVEVWKTRTALEVSVATIGFLLGVRPGVGTVILALSLGAAVQLVYRVGGKDLKSIDHRTLLDFFPKAGGASDAKSPAGR